MSQAKKGLFSFYFQSNLLIRILIGLILGAVFGLLFQNAGETITWLKPVGDLFIRLLKMIVVPVIACTLIVGASSISPAHLGKVGVKTIIYYLITSFLAIVIGLAVGSIFNPGLGLSLVQEGVAAGKESAAPSMVDIFLNMVPTNPMSAISKGQVLPMIFFCLFFGIALSFGRDSQDEKIRKASETVYDFFEGATQAMFKIVGWIMQYAPIGVFALIFIVFSQNGAQAFGPLANVTLSVYVAFILQLVLVYGIVGLLFRINPLRFFVKARPTMVTGFVTRSSSSTLPVSMDVAEKSMGVPRSIYGFTLPVGSTMNMDGSTIYLGVCAIFIANAVGLPLDFQQQLTIVLTAVLASIGTAGVPGAGAIMLLMVLESVGLNVTAGSTIAIAYGMILGIDALLDMGRTMVNVTGDLMGAVVVAKTEQALDEEIWNSDQQI